ncbi:diguanylate cyclase [Bacillus sp. CGMCC 1.16541]|uniref:diguanylate cyclase n=1 Tax=Bacillus sp. CGMCC 1.16541 TaxID=2185143 RepID=UPI000D740024|nr:diguanylate cyclase [Bacillus sp. CGMCC 1.16541]
MEKYQAALLKNIRETLKKWFEDEQAISHEEVIRFLHSLSGTAQTIGLTDLGEMARTLMEQIEGETPKQWSNSDLRMRLVAIITLCYQDEIIESDSKQERMVKGKSIVLLVDKDTSVLMHLKDEMERVGWYVLAVTDIQKAIQVFYESKPHCVVLDLDMQQQSSELVNFLHEQTNHRFVPTVMISEHHDKRTRLTAFEIGADDFIPKPIDVEEFVVRVKRHLERKKQFDYHLLVDELTNVYNRKYLIERFNQQQAEYKRLQEAYCIVMIDIDKFKSVNDDYGHLQGDQVLKEFASFLKSSMRSTDVIFRYGGEEFVLLLPRTHANDAKVLLDRLLEQFSIITFTHGAHSFSCTFSAGIVEVDHEDTPLDVWLDRVDQALYKAKESGRKQVVIACSSGQKRKRTLRIAIVDDDPVVRTMLTETMKKVDMEGAYDVVVQPFKDGETFLRDEWTHSDDQYVVILDGMMPKMDGLEVLQRLRKTKRHDKYKMIMLTTRKSEQDIKKALELGADDYMTKPFKLLEVEARIHHLMKRMK